jgi:SAM-dependent methyltransferase
MFRSVSLSTEAQKTAVRPCPLCGGLERKPRLRRDEWEIVECARCQMVFVGIELPYDVQARDYDWTNEHAKERSRREQKQPLMLFLSRLLRPLRPNPPERMLSHTLRWRREGKLVDLGCGEGDFLALASKYFDVMGVELSDRGVALSRQQIAPEKILQGPVTEVADGVLPEAAFDVATLFGYLEHEWNPQAALRSTYRVLKPGGIAVFKMPDYASWNRHIRGEKWCGYHIPAHCNYFTPQTLADMLRRTRFEPLPRPLADRVPTSDSLWIAARKPA